MKAIAALSWIVGCSLLPPVLAAQAPADSNPPASSSPDGYVIDAAKLVREGGARSIAELLISQVPGLLVVPGSGLTGAGARVRFAGARSLVGDRAPLVLVDGIRVDAAEDASLVPLGGAGPSRLDDLRPEDVESVEVVRGPASAAIYGAGAAAGVILIRTKTGRSGPARWEGYAQGALGFEPSRWPANYGGVDLDNPDVRMRTGGCSLAAQGAGLCVQDFVQSFNPLVQRSPFATAMRRQIGFSGSGGPRWGAFRVAGGLDSDDGAYSMPGVAPSDVSQRWNVQAGGAVRPLAGLEFTGNVAQISGNVRLPMYGPVQGALLGPSDSTGFAWSPLFDYSGRQKVDRTSGFVQVRWTPEPGLAIRGLLGLDDVDQRDGSRQLHSWADGHRQVRDRTSALSASVRGPTWPGLRFETTAGLEHRGRRLDQLQRQAIDTGSFCPVSNPCPTQGLAMRQYTTSVYLSEQVVVREKVFITAAVRREQVEGYRWVSIDPSVAVEWIARARTVGMLNRLQLRAAYGSVGEQPVGSLGTLFPSPVPLPGIRPDRTRSLEFGGDAALLGGTLNAGLTFYDMRSNVIHPVNVPSPSGFVSTYATGAEISNRGVAATLAGLLLDRPTLRWDVRLSVWGNRNRLAKLGSPAIFYGAGSAWAWQQLAEGYPVGGYWARPVQSYADANGDRIITTSELVLGPNFVWAGTPYPTQGLAVTSAWSVARRWHLSATLDYRAGQTLFNQTAWARCSYSLPVCRERVDPRTPLAAQATAVAGYRGYAPPEYFEDAEYLKLRELSVSVDIPTGAAAVLGARAATISLVGRNLATWTGYSGADPESGSYGLSTGGQPASILDFGTVPVPRSLTLRVQLAY